MKLLVVMYLLYARYVDEHIVVVVVAVSIVEVSILRKSLLAYTFLIHIDIQSPWERQHAVLLQSLNQGLVQLLVVYLDVA